MSLASTLEEIGALQHFRTVKCPKCGTVSRHHCLEIYSVCPNCNLRIKCRAFGGAGTEIEDVVDAVLKWAGSGEEFDAVMRRRKIVLSE